MRQVLVASGREIVEAGSVASALELLPSGFDLVLLDIGLPDGSGVDVAAAASKWLPAPLIIVLSGEATPQEAFALAQFGVVRFLSKPCSPRKLMLAVEHVTRANVNYEALLKTSVGRRDLREVQETVRRTMVREALAITGGNRSEAAKLLRVTRQAVQKFVRVKRGGGGAR